MHFGVVMFPTEYAIRPDELARALEERGFESLWVPEHTHIPASRRSPCRRLTSHKISASRNPTFPIHV